MFIDEIAWGTQPLFEEAGQVAGGNLTSICSATDQSRIRLADPVARLSWIDDCGGVFVCSGWLFSPSGHIMTNAHCANSASEAESLEAWFNWITASCDRNSEPNPDVYEGNTTLFSVNCNLDYTTFIVHDRTKGNPADVYGFLPIDSSNPRNGSEIWVPQHPGGNRKQISENCSVVTNQVGGFNFCSDPPSCPPVFGSPSGFVDLSFDCEIQGGSSGSPILNTDNFVIGIAHATTGSVNIGVRMRNIHTDIPNFPFAINFPAPDSINEGEPFQFNVTGTFLSGPTFEVTSSTVWTISPEGAATVDGDGVFVGGPVDADTLVTVTGSYTANDVTVERSVRITVLDAPDSPGDIVSSFPPHGAIDARQTSQLDGSEPAGWDSVELTFDGNIDSLAPQDFAISQLGGVAAAPAVMDVQLIGPQTIRLVLSDHITAGAWTTFLHEPSGTSIRLGYLPADTSGDGTSSAADIISLVDHLNGVGDPLPEWSTDTDRTGVANGADIVRLIDLLNGASELDEWLNVSLPTP